MCFRNKMPLLLMGLAVLTLVACDDTEVGRLG